MKKQVQIGLIVFLIVTLLISWAVKGPAYVESHTIWREESMRAISEAEVDPITIVTWDDVEIEEWP